MAALADVVSLSDRSPASTPAPTGRSIGRTVTATNRRVNDAIGTLEGESRAAVDHSDDNGYEKIELPLGFILKPIAENVGRNIEGAGRESGAGAKVLKGVTGISVRDGVNHGVFGGPNSIFRKPFGL